MDFDIVLPYQFYNLIMILVTIFFLLWGLRTIKRFYRALRIRSAIISDRMIQIRGLGSYLSYFEGASHSHINAIVHTRQSKPPVNMNPLFIPYIMESMILFKENGKLIIECSLTSYIQSRVGLLFDFNFFNFKKMVKERTKLGSNVLEDMDSEDNYFTSTSSVNNNSTSQASKIFPKLRQYECMSSNGLVREITPGKQKIVFSLDSQMETVLQNLIPAHKQRENRNVEMNENLELADLENSQRRESNSNAQTINPDTQNLDTQPPNTQTPENQRRQQHIPTLNVSLFLFPQHPIISSVNKTSFLDNERTNRKGQNVSKPGIGGVVPQLLVPLSKNPKSKEHNNDLEMGNVAGTNQNLDETTFSEHSENSTLVQGEVVKKPIWTRIFTTNKGNSTIPSNEDKNQLINRDPATFQDNNVLNPNRKITLDGLGAALYCFSVSAAKLKNFRNTEERPRSSRKKDCRILIPSSELAILDRKGNLFSSLEIFGLGSSNENQTEEKKEDNAEEENADDSHGTSDEKNETNSSIPSNSHTHTSGGKYVEEECVVCLSEPKEILLLPCRHLCVCSSCLIFIDKCPVCRSFFEEYISIQPRPSNTFNIPIIA